MRARVLQKQEQLKVQLNLKKVLPMTVPPLKKQPEMRMQMQTLPLMKMMPTNSALKQTLMLPLNFLQLRFRRPHSRQQDYL